jgi:hypothetical protein
LEFVSLGFGRPLSQPKRTVWSLSVC